MTPADVLRKAKEHISTPEMWFQGGFTSEMGDENDRLPKDGEPCCAIGAMMWASGKKSMFGMLGYDFLSQACPDLIVDFNDHRETTHADIMKLFDDAIALAEAGQ